jgi:hypothetical protein
VSEPSEYGKNAREALRARFAAAELSALSRRPYPDVLREARQRRADALVASGWEETEESRRETPVIRTLDAFYTEAEVLAGSHVRIPWDGGLFV